MLPNGRPKVDAYFQREHGYRDRPRLPRSQLEGISRTSLLPRACTIVVFLRRREHMAGHRWLCRDENERITITERLKHPFAHAAVPQRTEGLAKIGRAFFPPDAGENGFVFNLLEYARIPVPVRSHDLLEPGGPADPVTPALSKNHDNSAKCESSCEIPHSFILAKAAIRI